MRNNSALCTAREHAQSLRDAARLRLEGATRAEQAAREQLELLLGCRSESQARLQARAAGGCGAEVLRNFHAFFERLGQAVEQQRLVLGRHGARVQAERAALLQREIRVGAIGLLIERRERDGQVLEQRRLQRQADDRGAGASPGPLGAFGASCQQLVAR